VITSSPALQAPEQAPVPSELASEPVQALEPVQVPGPVQEQAPVRASEAQASSHSRS